MFGTEIDIPYCAAYISEIFSNLDRYNEYSLSSFTEYMTRLNWSASITKCIGFLHELL